MCSHLSLTVLVGSAWSCSYDENVYIHVHVLHDIARSLVSLFFTDPSLTHENVSSVMATVKLEDDELRAVLYVPDSKQEEIRQQVSTTTQERHRLIDYYLMYCEFATWDDLCSSLYFDGHHEALAAAKKFIKTAPGMG